jgi:hypothetical protein
VARKESDDKSRRIKRDGTLSFVSAGDAWKPGAGLGSRVLIASRSKAWLLLGASCFSDAAGIGMVLDGDRTGWLVLACSGSFTVLIMWTVRRPTRLELSDETMTHSVRGRSRTYELRRCGQFHVRDVPAGRWPFRYTRHEVTFNYDDPADSVVRRALARLAEATGSENHAFAPWVFGMRADEFAGLLNEYRVRALSDPGLGGKRSG